MKILGPMIICFTITLLCANTLPAGTVGDINNDGRIDLTEAIYALQVVSGSIVPEVPTLNLIIVLDRSGSMLGTKWDSLKIGLSEFFVAQSSVGINVGINFFPVQGAADQCDNFEFRPIQVPFGELTAYSPTLIAELGNQTPEGLTPTFPALYGTLVEATNFKDANADKEVIVVLISDGDPSICNTNMDDIANLASSAFNYNGVRTYTIAFQGANVSDLNMIAAAGGTQQSYDVTSDPSLLKTKMDEIVFNALNQ